MTLSAGGIPAAFPEIKNNFLIIALSRAGSKSLRFLKLAATPHYIAFFEINLEEFSKAVRFLKFHSNKTARKLVLPGMLSIIKPFSD